MTFIINIFENNRHRAQCGFPREVQYSNNVMLDFYSNSNMTRVDFLRYVERYSFTPFNAHPNSGSVFISCLVMQIDIVYMRTNYCVLHLLYFLFIRKNIYLPRLLRNNKKAGNTYIYIITKNCSKQLTTIKLDIHTKRKHTILCYFIKLP